MTKELSKSLFCVLMRNGVEIWMESERVEKLQALIENISGTKFINFDSQTINTADILGIFSAETMDEHTRRKNGQWKCENNFWHDHDTRCNCVYNKKCIVCGVKNPLSEVSTSEGTKCGECWSGSGNNRETYKSEILKEFSLKKMK